jgi:hypothetical protein
MPLATLFERPLIAELKPDAIACTAVPPRDHAGQTAKV